MCIRDSLEIDQSAKLAPAKSLEKSKILKLPLRPAMIELIPKSITPDIIVLCNPNLLIKIPAGTSNPMVPKCLAAIAKPTNRSPDWNVSLANIGKTGIRTPCPIDSKKLGAYTLQNIDFIENFSLFNLFMSFLCNPTHQQFFLYALYCCVWRIR